MTFYNEAKDQFLLWDVEKGIISLEDEPQGNITGEWDTRHDQIRVEIFTVMTPVWTRLSTRVTLSEVQRGPVRLW